MCFLYVLYLNIYERLYYCTVLKKNNNAEKAFSVITYRFEK